MHPNRTELKKTIIKIPDRIIIFEITSSTKVEILFERINTSPSTHSTNSPTELL